MNLADKEVILPLAFIVLLTLGQLGFRILGQSELVSTFPKADLTTYALLGGVLTLYACATAVWIYILSYMPLSKAIYINAVIFVTVPLSAKFAFSEDISLIKISVATFLILAALWIIKR